MPHRPDRGRSPEPPGRFAYDLERLLHERARLSIVSSLAAHREGLAFNDIKALCALTDGNLSRQLQALDEAGMVTIVKTTRGNRPHTIARLTEPGRRRFGEYIAELQRVVSDAADRGVRPAGGSRAEPYTA